MSGLIFSLRKRFMNLAKSTPPALPKPNATIPIARIINVCRLRKLAPVAVAPTERPRKMTTMFINSFCAVLDRRSTTPHSFIRLPSIRHPISGAADGRMRATIAVMMIGKTIFSVLDTGRSCPIFIARSFLVVNARMIGGWITGTRAIYEYAAIAIGPSNQGASLEVRKMDVGPSAPPMIPMEPASAGVKPIAFAQRKVTKIPICAAAPRRRDLGLAISGPKSVMAPTPMKIRQG